MLICSTCSHKNASGAATCERCGAPLEAGCPNCGHPVPAGNRFCGQCGSPLPEPKQPAKTRGLNELMPVSLAQKIRTAATEVVGERREVTVLFVDIANSTADAHRLDSEEMFLILDEALRLMAEVVFKYEGTIDKYTGDGLMALFGAPLTHENDPERAVQAALEIQRVLEPLQARVSREYGLDFQARIGVNTGSVIAGQVGGELRMEYTVMGDTVNLANRLQQAAQPGTVLVSFSTFQRTRPLFLYEALTPFPVTGKPHPIRAFQPLGAREQKGQPRGLPGLGVPMIGREDALTSTKDTLAEMCQEHRCRVVLITGQAGVGKSRLLREFRAAAARSGVSFYQSVCQNLMRVKPMGLATSLLRDIVQLTDRERPETQSEILAAYLDYTGLGEMDVMPYLIHLLGLEQVDPAQEHRLRQLDNVALSQLTFAALRQVLVAEARIAPTVLVFEDLHWVDPASQDFIEYLIRSVEDEPLMLVLISRDTQEGSAIQSLRAAVHQFGERPVELKLSPLSSQKTELLVDHLLQIPHTEALKQLIVQRAEGIPFFAEEIVRVLIEGEGIIPSNGNWQSTSRARELMHKVPGTLNGLILARFDRLPPEMRRMLQKASVLGPSFSYGMLQDISGVDPEELNKRLRVLEARQFLVPARFSTEEGYAFRHALMQDAVYSTLLKRDRKKIHDEAAQLIEQSTDWIAGERTQALAYHYYQGSNPSQALPYLITAGKKALRSCAYETAIQHLGQASALLQKQPGDHGIESVQVQLALGQALKFVGENASAFQTINTALQRLLRLDLVLEADTMLPALIEGLRELADIHIREGALESAIPHLEAGLDALGDEGSQSHEALWRVLIDRLAWIRFRQGKLDEAFKLASSATLRLDATDRDDPIIVASLHNTLGGIRWQQGNLGEAIAHVERSRDLYRSLGNLWGVANSAVNLGVLYVSQGDWASASENFEQGAKLYTQIGHLQNRAHVLNNLGTLRYWRGEHETAHRDLETSLFICRRMGDNWGMALAHISLARLAAVQSRFREAKVHAETALDHSQGFPAQQIEARWVLALCQAEEDLEQATASAERVLREARAAGLSELEAESCRLLGSLSTRAGDHLNAEVLLRESIDLCIQRRAPYQQGLALVELGHLYARLAEGDPATRGEWHSKARAAFSEAVEKFQSVGAAYDLRVAQEARSGLEVSAPSLSRTAAPGSGLAQRSIDLPEGDWRTAVILWLTFQPSPDADEEAAFETVALTMPSLIAIAEEYQGQVIRRQDGLTVAFGVPSALEDDAERAVETARQIAKQLTELSQQPDLSFTANLAVSMGQVVAGQVGHQKYSDLLVQGEPIREAQLLAETAPAGAVWVTAPVHDATERVFVFEDNQLQASATVTDAPRWRLVRRRRQPAPARGLPGFDARFVGRAQALRAMHDLAQNLARGLGGLVWIEGEPGIGKSRLMREFTASRETDERPLWIGKCSPQKTGTAFALFSDMLAQALDVQPTDPESRIRAKIDRALRAWPNDVHMARPYLEFLMGVWPEGLEGERLARLEPEQLRQQTFVALRRLCKSVADHQTLVVVLDDLHWIDAVSAELLAFLLTTVASSPLLLVCAQRRQGADLPNDRLIRLQQLIPSQTKHIRLERLSPPESHSLLTSLLPNASLGERQQNEILQRSEGNPYFIEEYVRMLIERGYLRKGEVGWEVDPLMESSGAPVPSSLETLIRSRIDTLPDDLKVVMQCAAVVGAPFEAALLGAVTEGVNAEGALRRLESRLLVSRGAEINQWTFAHSLIESVVYGAMLKVRRQQLHARVAHALERRWAGNEADHSETLAYHYVRAKDKAKALVYLMHSGEKAMSRYANEEAIGYFEQTARLLEVQPGASLELRWRLSAGLGDVYRSKGQYADSVAALQTGVALVESGELADDLRPPLMRRLGETAQKQGDLDTACSYFHRALALVGVPADLSEHTEVARILTGLAWAQFLQGHFDAARKSCEASLRHAEQAGALSEQAAAENLLGGICYRMSDLSAAGQHTRRAMVLREKMGYGWGVAATLSNLGILAIAAGDWSKGRAFLERSLALRQELGDVEGVAIAHNNLGMLTRDQGDLDQAEHHFRASLEIARPFEMFFHNANSRIGLAEVLLLKGEIDAARKAAEQSLAQAEAIGAQDTRAEIYRLQAQIMLEFGDLDEASQFASRSARQAAATGNPSHESAAYRVLSEIEIRAGNLEAAHEALHHAQVVLEGKSDELEMGRVVAQRGRLYLYQGYQAEAEADLRAAKMIFMRLGANLDLRRVEEALHSPESHEAPPPHA
jgi:predicted ATPase/class 3 adenylate cyclase/Tfp pilus assembly protein PilF